MVVETVQLRFSVTPQEKVPNCPACDSPLQSDAVGGLCPCCLLKHAMTDEVVASSPDEHEIVRIQGLFPELEIEGLAGEGGMGTVYRTRQPRLGRRVALKVLAKGRMSGVRDDFGLRFEREAKTLAALSHPNVVAVHDFGERDGLWYLLMEHVEGSDLRRTLARGKLPLNEALEIFLQVCEGLQAAHARGVVHRDLKPANILIGDDGRARLADFGLAKRFQADGQAVASNLTVSGVSMGTAVYAAPEQMKDPENCDHRADLFSLGVLLYELLTGDRPSGAFRRPSDKSSEVDPRLDAVVMRAMDEEPARRFQDVDEFRDSVLGIMDSRRCGETARKGWLAVLAGLVLFAVISLIAMRGDRSTEVRERTTEETLVGNLRDRNPASPFAKTPERLFILATDPTARDHCPGAPWEEDRADIIDLQVSPTNINGYRGPPMDHVVTVALTAEGSLVDWINTIPGKSIIPKELRDREVIDFCVKEEGNRSAALLANGELHAWRWWLDPEKQTVRVSETERIAFSRRERPVALKALSHDTIAALFVDGSVEVDPPDFQQLDSERLRGLGRLRDISGNLLALTWDGTLVDVRATDRPPNKPLVPLPLTNVRLVRDGPFLPVAILNDGGVWYWNENNSDVVGDYLVPTLSRAKTDSPVVDVRVLQSGDVRFAVKTETGRWYVSHGDLADDQRAEIQGASKVFREEHFVIGLMPVHPASESIDSKQ